MPRDMTGLVWLESTVREEPGYAEEPWWPRDRPALATRLSLEQGEQALRHGLPISVVGLLSLNANGHVRERATRALSAHRGGEEIPFLMLRANDWVSQIANAARRALEER